MTATMQRRNPWHGYGGRRRASWAAGVKRRSGRDISKVAPR